MSWFGWNGENPPPNSGAPSASTKNTMSFTKENESGDETDFYDVPEVAPASVSPPSKSFVPTPPKKRSKSKSKAAPPVEETPRHPLLKLTSKLSPPSPVIDFEGIDPPDQDGPDLQVVIDQVFNLTSRQFFEFFLSDQPVFSLGDFHVLRGDKDILISHWSEHVPLSAEEQAKSKWPVDPRIRPGTLERRVKLNIKVDSSFSRLHKVQRLVPSPNHDGFLMITHAITPDVIFGTQFSVTDIWQLQDIPGQRQCRLQISLGALFMNSGWAVTMLIPIIRSRIVSEGQEMWQHWSEVAKLRVSRLAHELMKSPQGSNTSPVESSPTDNEGEEDDDLTEYTEDERQAARGGVGNVSGVSGTVIGGAVFDVSVMNDAMKETLDALRAIELGEAVSEEERRKQEEIIKQQVREQQRMIEEKQAEKEKLKAKLAEQQRLQQEALLRQQQQTGSEGAQEGSQAETKASPASPVKDAAAKPPSPTPTQDKPSDPQINVGQDGRTHIVFDPDAFVLDDSDSDDDSTESDTDAAEVAQMTPAELEKHEKRVKRRLKDRRRRHQRQLLRAAKRAADADSVDSSVSSSGSSPLPLAVTSNISNDGVDSKMHMSLAEIAAREAKVAEDLAVQNRRMCTRECKPTEYAPCTIM